MLRMFMFLGAITALLAAFALYTVNYQTRLLADHNQRMEDETVIVKRDISILRAERAYLMRPERIEPLARKLGMQPVDGRQFIRHDELQSPPQRP